MEIIIGLVVPALGGLVWLMMTLGNLKGRLEGLESKDFFKNAAQEFKQKEDAMLEAAQQRLNNELNPERILQKIDTVQQQAVQQIEELQLNLSGVKTALQELEVAKQRALAEITQASSLEQLLALEHQINQSVDEFKVKIAETVNQVDARRLALEQDAEQFSVKVRKQVTELEQQREQVTSEIAKLKTEAIRELKEEVRKLQLPVVQPVAPVTAVVQPVAPVTALVETLPEITFETAFIDSNKNIRRETRKARQLVETLPNNVKLEMIYVPGGTFMMGSEDYDDEKPIHQVTLEPFLVGKYPVTQAQWEAIMGGNPSKFKGANRPVETVTWDDAMQCCAKLSQLTGQQYRLLSEAQWEYACRAGSVTKYSFGEINTPELANYDTYDTSAIKQTTEVGKYPANPFGLYDMHGNVWEWCEDVSHGNYNKAPVDGSAWVVRGSSNKYIRRGGSWTSNYHGLRCATRIKSSDRTRGCDDGGFRFSRVNL